MPNTNITEHRRTAAGLANRLRSTNLPSSLGAAAKAFLAAQKSFEAAATSTDTAQETRDASLALVAKSDALLDASVDTLVNLLPGAGLGTRLQPLKGYSSKTPSELKNMPYADEPDEVDRVVKKILAKKPSPDVVKACKASSACAADVRKKLAAYPSAQAAYTKALSARDGLLPALQKATDSLKRHAAVAWENDAATLKSVFAAPTKVEAPVKKRAKKKVTPKPTAPTAPTTPAATP